MLKEDNTLAAETASEEDENAAGLESGARTSGPNRFADLGELVLANGPQSQQSRDCFAMTETKS